MEPKFMISEVFGTSWKYTKSQIWVLVGLFIGYFILSSIIICSVCQRKVRWSVRSS